MSKIRLIALAGLLFAPPAVAQESVSPAAALVACAEVEAYFACVDAKGRGACAKASADNPVFGWTDGAEEFVGLVVSLGERPGKWLTCAADLDTAISDCARGAQGAVIASAGLVEDCDALVDMARDRAAEKFGDVNVDIDLEPALDLLREIRDLLKQIRDAS